MSPSPPPSGSRGTASVGMCWHWRSSCWSLERHRWGPDSGLRVWGLRVWGLRVWVLRVWGLKVWNMGLRVWGLKSMGTQSMCKEHVAIVLNSNHFLYCRRMTCCTLKQLAGAGRYKHWPEPVILLLRRLTDYGQKSIQVLNVPASRASSISDVIFMYSLN
jgi:hypothetical protein